MKLLGLATVLVACLASPTRAADWLVDASGAQSHFTNINAAMALASPGDRILVLPGNYPAFQFSRGVDVVGLGESPDDVRIVRVDFHVSVPAAGYSTLLSNVALGDGSAASTLAFTGNELSPGVLVIDGVEMVGGVFIGGGAHGFYMMMSNTTVDPPAGFGFGGAAVHLGGAAGFAFDIASSSIRGWDADPSLMQTAGAGLHLAGAVRGRIAASAISGGDGSGIGGSFGAGADALGRFGPPASVTLRLDGLTSVHGGAGQAAPGGDGVDLQGAIEVGTAVITAGAGLPAGSAWAGAQSVPTATPALLSVLPAIPRGAPIQHPGDVLELKVNAPASSCVLVITLDLALPGSASFAVHGTPLLVALTNDLPMAIPSIPNWEYSGLMIYGQAYVRPAGGGKLVLTNAVGRRIDFAAGVPDGGS